MFEFSKNCHDCIHFRDDDCPWGYDENDTDYAYECVDYVYNCMNLVRSVEDEKKEDHYSGH